MLRLKLHLITQIALLGVYIAGMTVPAGQAYSNVLNARGYTLDSRASGRQAVGQSSQKHDFYVAMNGNDASDGSQAHPWATITHAGKIVGPGATVHVLSGTYNERVVTSASGTASARIKYVSERKWRAVISPAAHGSITWQNSGDYADIDEFEIAGSDCNGIGLAGSHQRAIGNNVHNAATGCSNSSGGSAINDYSYTSEDNDIVGNYVHDVGIGDPLCGQAGHRTVQGIYQSNRGGHIENNVAAHNCVFGIQLWHAATHATIVNNTVVYNRGGGIIVGTGDAPCNTGGCPGGDDYTVVRNNIVAFNGNPELKGWGIVESSGDVGTHNQYSHNLGYQNVSGDFALAHHLLCDNCIQGKNPAFVNAEGDDFRLTATSPARGGGTRRDAPEMDFDNKTRLQVGAVDIGAYEPNGN